LKHIVRININHSESQINRQLGLTIAQDLPVIFVQAEL